MHNIAISKFKSQEIIAFSLSPLLTDCATLVYLILLRLCWLSSARALHFVGHHRRDRSLGLISLGRYFSLGDVTVIFDFFHSRNFVVILRQLSTVIPNDIVFIMDR